jgi:hypothetical protein
MSLGSPGARSPYRADRREIAVNYPLLNVFFTTMWFFLWILWFFLLFRVFSDLFRDHTTSGWAKAGWSVALIVLPFLGVLIYLIARGHGMSERETAQAERSDQEVRAYIQQAAAADAPASASAKAPAGPVDELTKLADLKNHGDITEEEYQRAKEHVLAA